MVNYRKGNLALAHNGNLTNARVLREELVNEGAIFQTTSDTEVILHLIARSRIEDQIEIILEEDNIWHAIIRPMRKTITLAEMKEEQNYTPLDEKTFFELAEKVDIEESIEELLAMLD